MADDDGRAYGGRKPQMYADEFADFIEEDEFDGEEREALRDEAEVRRPGRGFIDPVRMQSGLDESAQEDMMAAFGDGTEYDWALQLQEEGEEHEEGLDKPLELKDVFEPSQLVDRMLTEADNVIRNADIPERYQIARQPFKEMELSDDEVSARMQEETMWISNFLLPKKRLDRDLYEPFRQVIADVLRFMNVEDLEIPFILHNRKDYLIHEERVPLSPHPNDPDAPKYEIKASRLLQNSDLWEIYELDLKYRAFVEKREALSRSIESIRSSMPDFNDEIFNDMIPAAVTMEELQDVQDYLHFQYAAQLKDTTVYDAETNGTQKRARGTRNVWDKVRAGQAYHMVRAFGISADALAQNALKVGTRQYTEDPAQQPDEMADGLVGEEYSNSAMLLAAAKAMYAEELAQSPRMRKLLRQNFYMDGVFDCYRTEKGLRRIDEEHPYYEFKYLRGKDLRSIASKPELFLRMLKAEDEGLVEVRVRMEVWDRFKESLYKLIMSDNFSTLADAWNALRKEVLDMALEKLCRVIVKGVKENLKTECEAQIARACREEYANKLDQAPFKPQGMVLGTTPRVLALSNGAGKRNDAICWAYVDENGRVLENGKFVDIRMGNKEKYLPDGPDVANFVDLVERRKPDVVAVSGFSVETRRLYKDLQDVIEAHDLRGTPYEDDDGSEQSDKLEVVITTDEVARLYYTSDRAAAEHPTVPPLTRYCIALAKYMQSPLKEYAALGRDIVSISFTPHQTLIPQEKVLKHLEMAMIETVNLVGVDINEAVSDTYTANLLQYVSGLGPRKAAHLLKVININGGDVNTRDELVGDPDRNKRPAVSGGKIFENCASFLFITYDDAEPDSDYLDNTRVHPEDYETARKIVADTLDLDEEDVKAEIDDAGPNAVVRKLIKDDAQDKLNDLVLDDYADEILRKLGLKKKATLELIRGELQQPYEELRRSFYLLSTEEVFTMLTGETKQSLSEGMIVPVSIKRTFPDHIDVKLDCGIDGTINEQDFPSGVGVNQGGAEPRHVWQTHQTVQAKLIDIEHKRFTARLSLREEDLRQPFRREFDHEPGQWDEQQEAQDKKEAMHEKDAQTGRAQRVIKHPLFHPFNSAQAEEFLGSQAQGDVVIRPSSKGLDHLAVTWKVSENVFQHIDVLELDKENEFSVGRTLKVGGNKYTYTDLDELIVLHVKAMAKKVDEIMTDERYQKGSRETTCKQFSSSPLPLSQNLC